MSVLVGKIAVSKCKSIYTANVCVCSVHYMMNVEVGIESVRQKGIVILPQKNLQRILGLLVGALHPRTMRTTFFVGAIVISFTAVTTRRSLTDVKVLHINFLRIS